MKRLLSILLRIIISAVMLVLVFRDQSWSGQMMPHLHALAKEWRWSLAGLASVGLSVLVHAWRWWIVLKVQVPGVSFGLAFRATLVSGLFNIASFGPIGPDTYRILALRKHFPRQGMAIGASVVLDHLAGLIAMAMVYLGFGLVALKQWPGQTNAVQGILKGFSAFLLISSVGIVLAVVSLSPTVMNWGRKRLPWLLNHPFMVKMEESFKPLWTTWPSSLLASFISLSVFFFSFFAFYCGVRAVGGHADLMTIMIAMPIVDMAAAIPISLSGLGVREKTFETLMSALSGLPKSTAVAGSLAGWVFNVIWGLIGGVVFILGKPKGEEPEVAAVEA